jgi:hypothetical protein
MKSSISMEEDEGVDIKTGWRLEQEEVHTENFQLPRTEIVRFICTTSKQNEEVFSSV